MMRKRVSGRQEAFAWPEAVVAEPSAPAAAPPKPVPAPAIEPEYAGKKLDAEGHRFWAGFCRSGQDYCVGMTTKDEANAEEWAGVARQWKAASTKHEAMANLMEGVRG